MSRISLGFLELWDGIVGMELSRVGESGHAQDVPAHTEKTRLPQPCVQVPRLFPGCYNHCGKKTQGCDNLVGLILKPCGPDARL